MIELAFKQKIWSEFVIGIEILMMKLINIDSINVNFEQK